jgi:hypothetical protein
MVRQYSKKEIKEDDDLRSRQPRSLDGIRKLDPNVVLKAITSAHIDEENIF